MILSSRRVIDTLAVSVAILLLSACGNRMPNTDEAASEGILLLGNGAEPESIDPHLATGFPDSLIIESLIEGLIAYHRTDDNSPEPGIADRWSSSNGARTWTFNLRPTAKWSNGDPVTAPDFVYSYNRILSQAIASEYANMLYVMQNAEAFHSGKIDDFSQVGVKAIDDHTLEFKLIGPTPHFTSMLKHTVWYPVHKGTIETHGGMTSRISQWTRAGNYVGTGPFQLEEWIPNHIIKVKRNPYYWDAENVKLNAIYFFPFDNINTEMRAFENGQLHKTYTIPPEAVANYQSQPVFRNDPWLNVYYFMINTTRPPLDDIRVRKALSYAIDRRSITENITRRGEIPATGYTPPGFNNYNPPRALLYDPVKARELLAEAGFPNGQGFPVKQILFNTREDHRAISEAIQQMWRENLNIEVELYNQEWKVYLETRNRMEYDIARAGWVGDYMDPETFLAIWRTEENDSLNDTGWSNSEFDALLQSAYQSESLEERYQHLQNAEAILLEELPNLPVFWSRKAYLIDPRVKGWEPKLLDKRNFKFISLEN